MYKRKTEDIYYIMGCYYGEWDIVDSCKSLKEAKTNLKLYRENEIGTPFEIRIKREKIKAEV